MTRGVLLLIYDLIRMRAARNVLLLLLLSAVSRRMRASWCFRLSDRTNDTRNSLIPPT